MTTRIDTLIDADANLRQKINDTHKTILLNLQVVREYESFLTERYGDYSRWIDFMPDWRINAIKELNRNTEYLKTLVNEYKAELVLVTRAYHDENVKIFFKPE